jgi:hypothetical protein
MTGDEDDNIDGEQRKRSRFEMARKGVKKRKHGK